MSGRIRTVKPEFLEDEKLAAASDEARLLSIGLLLIADDHGRGRAHPSFIASQVWAYSREARESLGNVARASRALMELAGIGFVTLYDVAGQRYFHVRNWAKHQRVDHPGKPRVPGPQEGELVEVPPAPAPPEEPAAAPAAPLAAVEVAPPPAATPPSAEARTLPLFHEPVVEAATAAPKSAAGKAQDAADVAYARYRAARTAKGMKGTIAATLPKLDKSRAAIARLMSPQGGNVSLESLCNAAEGIWEDQWRREVPTVRAKFSLISRDIEHLQGFEADFLAATAAPALGSTVAAPPPPRSPAMLSPGLSRPLAPPPARTFAPAPKSSSESA